MPYDELTRNKLEVLRDKIRAVLNLKGIDATGSASESLEVKGNELFGNDYIYFLDKGRKPGKFPPVKNIIEWIRQKLGINDGTENRIAYAIGYVMKRDGTRIYQDQSKGIELDKLVDEMLNELYEELPETAKVEVLTWL
jgi:hypothetical protein